MCSWIINGVEEGPMWRVISLVQDWGVGEVVG